MSHWVILFSIVYFSGFDLPYLSELIAQQFFYHNNNVRPSDHHFESRLQHYQESGQYGQKHYRAKWILQSIYPDDYTRYHINNTGLHPNGAFAPCYTSFLLCRTGASCLCIPAIKELVEVKKSNGTHTTNK